MFTLMQVGATQALAGTKVSINTEAVGCPHVILFEGKPATYVPITAGMVYRESSILSSVDWVNAGEGALSRRVEFRAIYNLFHFRPLLDLWRGHSGVSYRNASGETVFVHPFDSGVVAFRDEGAHMIGLQDWLERGGSLGDGLMTNLIRAYKNRSSKSYSKVADWRPAGRARLDGASFELSIGGEVFAPAPVKTAAAATVTEYQVEIYSDSARFSVLSEGKDGCKHPTISAIP